jgi:DNA-binding NarL/FixJ family response regulator
MFLVSKLSNILNHSRALGTFFIDFQIKSLRFNRALMPIRICLAEDNEDDILLFRTVLQHLRVPFLFTGRLNGGDLRDHIMTQLPLTPDYIFLGTKIPQEDWYQTLQAFRHLLPDTTPIFMMASASDTPAIRRALNLGASGYISKGILPADFSNAIRAILTADPGSFDGCKVVMLPENADGGQHLY